MLSYLRGDLGESSNLTSQLLEIAVQLRLFQPDPSQVVLLRDVPYGSSATQTLLMPPVNVISHLSQDGHLLDVDVVFLVLCLFSTFVRGQCHFLPPGHWVITSDEVLLGSFSYDTPVLIPVYWKLGRDYSTGHWGLVFADGSNRITYYDSSIALTKRQASFGAFCRQASQVLGGRVAIGCCPQQTDGSSCGLFMLWWSIMCFRPYGMGGVGLDPPPKFMRRQLSHVLCELYALSPFHVSPSVLRTRKRYHSSDSSPSLVATPKKPCLAQEPSPGIPPKAPDTPAFSEPEGPAEEGTVPIIKSRRPASQVIRPKASLFFKSDEGNPPESIVNVLHVLPLLPRSSREITTQCRYCNDSFSQWKLLVNHIYHSHPARLPPGFLEQELPCHYCSMIFTASSIPRYKQHLAEHLQVGLSNVAHLNNIYDRRPDPLGGSHEDPLTTEEWEKIEKTPSAPYEFYASEGSPSDATVYQTLYPFLNRAGSGCQLIHPTLYSAFLRRRVSLQLLNLTQSTMPEWQFRYLFHYDCVGKSWTLFIASRRERTLYYFRTGSGNPHLTMDEREPLIRFFSLLGGFGNLDRNKNPVVTQATNTVDQKTPKLKRQKPLGSRTNPLSLSIQRVQCVETEDNTVQSLCLLLVYALRFAFDGCDQGRFCWAPLTTKDLKIHVQQLAQDRLVSTEISRRGHQFSLQLSRPEVVPSARVGDFVDPRQRYLALVDSLPANQLKRPRAVSESNSCPPSSLQGLYRANRPLAMSALRSRQASAVGESLPPINDLLELSGVDRFFGEKHGVALSSEEPGFLFTSSAVDEEHDITGIAISIDEVQEALKKCKSAGFTSPGPDGRTYQHWEDLEGGLQLLVELFNFILEGQPIPVCWKESYVRLIPKIPHPQSLHDYRPIVLGNTGVKILSHILLSRLQLLSAKHSWISANQVRVSWVVSRERETAHRSAF